MGKELCLCMLYVVICLSVYVALFAFAMPISIKRTREAKCSEYDDQFHFIEWWLIARELIDHGAKAVECREVA